MTELISNVVSKKNLRTAQLRAMKLFATTVGNTYGPLGEYTVYSRQNVDKKTLAISNYTKDGFTVLKNIEVDKPIESLLKDEIIDICINVIKKVGDGTSSAVILSYLIFERLLKLEEFGKYSKRDITNTFKKYIDKVINEIESHKRKCTLEDIYYIALTSLNGNEELANIIYSIYAEYGMEAFIDVSTSNTPNTIVKGYDGMIYNNGFIDPCFINDSISNSCILNKPKIYIFDNPIDTPEMLSLLSLIIKKEIMDKIQTAEAKVKAQEPITDPPSNVLILCPFISRDANSFIDSIIKTFSSISIDNRAGLCIVTDFSDTENLVDVMNMTGAKFIKKYIDPDQYKIDQEKGLAPTYDNIELFAGEAEKIVVTATSTKIINPMNMRDENNKLTVFYKNYIKELESILAKYEEINTEVVKIGSLKRRINILKGNMVDLFIGGFGTSDRNSLKDSVEDAVLNCRSAVLNGVGLGANYEGLKAIYKIRQENIEEQSELDTYIIGLIYDAYLELVNLIYKNLYSENDSTKIKEDIVYDLKNDEVPLNIISGKHDKTIISSIKTETSILEAISKIISVIFNTNQFLVPDPRFNIYNWDKSDDPIQTI